MGAPDISVEGAWGVCGGRTVSMLALLLLMVDRLCPLEKAGRHLMNSKGHVPQLPIRGEISTEDVGHAGVSFDLSQCLVEVLVSFICPLPHSVIWIWFTLFQLAAGIICNVFWGGGRGRGIGVGVQGQDRAETRLTQAASTEGQGGCTH